MQLLLDCYKVETRSKDLGVDKLIPFLSSLILPSIFPEITGGKRNNPIVPQTKRSIFFLYRYTTVREMKIKDQPMLRM